VYVLPVSLVAEWRALQESLPAGWGTVGLELTVDGDADRAAALLAPAQPYRVRDGALRLVVARSGGATTPGALERLLRRLDDEGVRGSLAATGSEEAAAAPAPAQPAELPLAEAWAAELAKLPADWSDVFGEIVLLSSDYRDQAALQLAPVNPRLTPPGTVFSFRCAARFGYGASPGMVARCLERCDAKGIRGTVRVLRALSDTRPVGTQGPVWHVAGRTV
jgi:hypothetical protein